MDGSSGNGSCPPIEQNVDAKKISIPENSNRNEHNDHISEAFQVLDDIKTLLRNVNKRSAEGDTITEHTNSDDDCYAEKINKITEILKTLLGNKSNVSKDLNKSIDVSETKNSKAHETIQHLREQLNLRMQNEERFNLVMAEYEKTISNLVAEKGVIVEERDTAQRHLANVEAAFTDVHQKYERCKNIIEGFKTNEAVLKDTIRINEEQIIKQNNKYEALKTHAMAQLEKANNELSEITRNHGDEITRMRATMQKLELKANSLTQQVEQKTKECEELTRICDDLINKVGR